MLNSLIGGFSREAQARNLGYNQSIKEIGNLTSLFLIGKLYRKDY